MTDPFSGTIVRPSARALRVTILALVFAAASASAAQITRAASQATVTSQTPETQQVTGQDTNKAAPEKSRDSEKSAVP